jgi:hypothetical protein
MVMLLFPREYDEEGQVRAKHEEIEALLAPPPTLQRREDVQGSSQLTQTAGRVVVDVPHDATFQTLPEQENSAEDDKLVSRATIAVAVLWL